MTEAGKARAMALPTQRRTQSVPVVDPWMALLSWYDRAKRDLPWRRTRDPYRILVSEIMLQQTQVKTVLGYYDAFLERFPDLESLARASEDEVLAAWKGLGYYRRARNLQACAKEAVAEHGGRLPDSYEALRAMRGIGEYTAAAVASIAFGEAKGVVDGNVLRVMARYLGIEEPIDGSAARRAIQRAVDEAISRERPGDFNQALMELGATLCTPQRPQCEACPLMGSCDARARGLVDRLPLKKRREQPTLSQRVVAVVQKGDRILLVKRPADGLLGGMWEFLNLEMPEMEALGRDRSAWSDRCRMLLGESVRALTGDEVIDAAYAGRVIHRFSHRVWEMDVYWVTVSESKARESPPDDGHSTESYGALAPSPAEGVSWTWQPLEAIDEVALPRVMQKAWEACRWMV